MSACPYFDILTAVGGEVEGVAGVNAVSVRRRPLQLDGIDPTPHVIVWPGEGAESVDSMQFGSPGGPARVVWVYPVLVVIVIAGNRVVEMGLKEYLTVRQGVRDALFRPLLGGAATVHDCDTAPQDVFDKIAFAKGNYDVSGFQCLFKSSEVFNTP